MTKGRKGRCPWPSQGREKRDAQVIRCWSRWAASKATVCPKGATGAAPDGLCRRCRRSRGPSAKQSPFSSRPISSPLDVSGYGTWTNALAEGHDIDETNAA